MDLTIPKLIVGGNLSALLYSYINNIPLVYVNKFQKTPYPFEFFSTDIDLSKFYIDNENEINKFSTNRDKSEFIYFGMSKKRFYEKIIFLSSLGGLIPFTNKICSFIIEQEKKIINVLMDKDSIKINYEKIIIFDDKNIKGILPSKVKEEQEYLILDWFHVICGQNNKLEYVQRKDKFVNKLFFYACEDIDGNISREDTLKDVLCFSYLNKKDLQKEEYSFFNTKEKVKEILRSLGIEGSKNGYFYLKDGTKKPNIDKVNLKHLEREKIELNKNKYKNYDDSIEFKLNIEPEEVIKEYNKIENRVNNYTDFLNKVFFGFNKK